MKARASSPAPGICLLMRTRPSSTTYIASPGSPSRKSTSPLLSWRSLDSEARKWISIRDSFCSWKRSCFWSSSRRNEPVGSRGGGTSAASVAPLSKNLVSRSLVARSFFDRLRQKVHQSAVANLGPGRRARQAGEVRRKSRRPVGHRVHRARRLVDEAGLAEEVARLERASSKVPYGRRAGCGRGRCRSGRRRRRRPLQDVWRRPGNGCATHTARAVRAAVPRSGRTDPTGAGGTGCSKCLYCSGIRSAPMHDFRVRRPGRPSWPSRHALRLSASHREAASRNHSAKSGSPSPRSVRSLVSRGASTSSKSLRAVAGSPSRSASQARWRVSDSARSERRAAALAKASRAAGRSPE